MAEQWEGSESCQSQNFISLIIVTSSSQDSLLALMGIIIPSMSMQRFGGCKEEKPALQDTGQGGGTSANCVLFDAWFFSLMVVQKWHIQERVHFGFGSSPRLVMRYTALPGWWAVVATPWSCRRNSALLQKVAQLSWDILSAWCGIVYFDLQHFQPQLCFLGYNDFENEGESVKC